MNKKLFEYIYAFSENSLIEKIAYAFSYPITYGLLVFVFIWAIFIHHKKMRAFSLLFLSGFSAWFLSSALKFTLQIPRPFVELGFTPAYNETSFSFPSSHTSVFFALAFVVYSINRRLGIGMYILAGLIALSRIVLGVHYPGDILGGIVLGILVGYSFVRLFKKLNL